MITTRVVEIRHGCIELRLEIQGRFSLESCSVFVHQVIEDLGGSHGHISLDGINLVVSTNITGGSLAINQILYNLLLVVSESLGQRCPGGVLGSQSLRPVESNVEVCSSVVDLLYLPAGRLVVVQPLTNGVHHGLAQQLRLGVVGPVAQLLEANGGGEVLTKGVPPEMTFLQELLDMLGSRATSSGLQENSTSQERDDGQHLGGGSQLEDGEKVGEVISEHIAGAGDGVQSLPGSGAGDGAGISRLGELNITPVGVVVIEVLGHQGDQVGIVSARRIQPEHHLGAGGLTAAGTGLSHFNFHLREYHPLCWSIPEPSINLHGLCRPPTTPEEQVEIEVQFELHDEYEELMICAV
jgi:hypothetical protein